MNMTEDIYTAGNISCGGTNSPSAATITNDHCAPGMALAHSKMAVETKTCTIPLTAFRKSAAQKDDLPDAPDATDLGLADAQGSIITGTQTNNTSASEKAVVLVALPDSYSAASAITVRVRAKVSAARNVSQTVDVVAKVLADGALGSDICTTAAQTLTTSYANYDFTITPTSRAAGDLLNIELTLATNDTGGSTNGTPTITAVQVLCGCKV